MMAWFTQDPLLIYASLIKTILYGFVEMQWKLATLAHMSSVVTATKPRKSGPEGLAVLTGRNKRRVSVVILFLTHLKTLNITSVPLMLFMRMNIHGPKFVCYARDKLLLLMGFDMVMHWDVIGGIILMLFISEIQKVNCFCILTNWVTIWGRGYFKYYYIWNLLNKCYSLHYGHGLKGS